MSIRVSRRAAGALAFVATCFSLAAAAADTRQWFVRAHYDNPAQLQALAGRSQHLRVDRARQEVALDVDADGLQLLQDLGFTVQVDLVDSARLQSVTAALEGGRALQSIPGFACYRTVEETYASEDALVANRPDLASIIEIGNSWQRTQNAAQGYRLRVLKLTNSATDGATPKPKMFAMFGIHAREYTTAELGMRLAEWLVNNYGKDPQATWLLDRYEFHFLPQSNPDGRKRAESGLSWRKNTDTINGNCPTNANSSGIDLNRNYPYKWNTVPNGSSGSVCVETYRGPTAGSEPETQAVVNYVTSIFPDRRVDDPTVASPADYQGLFFDVHSYSQLVLWPWGFDVTAPNAPALEALGRRLAWYNGYTPEQSKDLYPTDGTTDDTFYGMLGVPAYTIELGIAFFEDCASFEADTYPKNTAALLYAARTLQAPFQLPGGPDAVAVTAAPDLIAAGTPIDVRASIDDGRYNQGNGGTVPVHAITGATATLDAPPWDAGAVPLPLSAADGNFDATHEDVTGALSSAGLAPGRHLLFVQGQDLSGAKGPPTAAFVDIAAADDVGTLAGQVRDGIDGHALAGAKVRVQGTGQDYSANSAVDGRYVRTAHPGNVAIDVSAPGYLPVHRDITLRGAATRQQDFTLFPQCTAFADDIEGATTAWTAQAPWGVVTNVAGNATHAWTDSPAGNYTNNRNVSLTTRSFDFSAASDVSLRFDHKCATEAGFDFGHVEVSIDAAHTTWTEVYRCSGQPTWETREVALPTAGGHGDVRVRFRFTSDGGVTDEGWTIDNVRIASGGTACAAQYASDEIFPDGFGG